MLAFKCPACKTTVRLPDSARGERIVCGHCGESVFVAGSTEPSQSVQKLQQIPAAVVVRRGTQRRRKQPSVWKLVPHVIIASVTAYAAWRMYDSTVNRPRPVPAAAAVAAKPKPLRPKVAPANHPSPSTPPVVQATPTVEAPPVPVAPAQPAFANLPSAVTLPPSSDAHLTTLATTTADSSIALLTNAKELSLVDSKIKWGDAVIAGIRSDKGEIQFRWSADVPPEAEAALRNSIVRLTSPGDEHFVALREPVVGEPLALDLRDHTHRVNAKCDWLPPAENMRLAVSLTGQIPVKKIDGPSVDSLALRDETILVYDFKGDAATKVTIRKAGESIAAVLASQYVLPSGDVEPLSIARGTRMMKQLQELQASAADATQALPRLQVYRRNLDRDFQSAMSMRTGSRLAGGGYIDNPVAVAQRNAAVSAVQQEIVATEQNIGRAQQLIDDRPSIEADIAGMIAVETLAKSIDKAPLPYRFFIIVEGHEVDLIRWAPGEQAIENIPAVLAQPVKALPPAPPGE